MEEKAEHYKDPPVRGAEAEEMPEELQNELLGYFLEKAEDPDEDFNALCRVLTILVEQGVRDEKALEIVRRRFTTEGGHYAAWVLHEAGHEEDIVLFVDKIREFFGVANEQPDKEFGFSFDLHNWLAFIPKEDERYPQILRDGLSSPNASVRNSAYFFLDSAPFPLEERVAFVRSGLRDPNQRVRYWAARYYVRNQMADEDWDLLRDAAEQEGDDRTRKEMHEVLKRREQ